MSETETRARHPRGVSDIGTLPQSASRLAWGEKKESLSVSRASGVASSPPPDRGSLCAKCSKVRAAGRPVVLRYAGQHTALGRISAPPPA